MSENQENMTDQENAMCDITIVHQDILDKVKKEITL